MKFIQDYKQRLLVVSLFAIAMAFIESAVVVYLREIYYPNGFDFPLVQIDLYVGLTEILREVATIVLLICIGYMAGSNLVSRFAYFIFSFAIWDIYYYVFLKLILGWPENLLTWDILFLIPVTWVGPVITPIILSFSMIMLGVIILYYQNKNEKAIIKSYSWLILIGGSLLIIFVFCLDYSNYVLAEYSFSELFSMQYSDDFKFYIQSYIPSHFNWFLFILGEIIILMGILSVYFSNKKNKYHPL